MSGIAETRPSLPQTGDFDPDPLYYEADVHMAVYGGFRPNMVRERFYHMARTYSDGHWSVELNHPEAALAPGGVSGTDVARVTITGSGKVTATSRSGQIVAMPDLASARAGMRQALGVLSSSVAVPARSTALARQSSAQSGPLTSDVIGRAVRQRVLARFRSPGYVEQAGTSGRRRFEWAQGARRMLFEVDTVTGTTVREEVHEGGRLVSATSREYRSAGAIAVLEREVTTQFDAAGAPRERFERSLTNVRTERSR